MAARTLAERLATYAAGLTFDKLTKEAVHETKRRVIDSLATAVGAMPAEAYHIAKKCALRVSSNPGASMLGGGRTSVEWATFVNGLLIRYLDFNDTYLSKEPAHPSDNLAPVLAVGEAVGAGGRELITAAVLAYEIQCRFCDAASLRKHGIDLREGDRTPRPAASLGVARRPPHAPAPRPHEELVRLPARRARRPRALVPDPPRAGAGGLLHPGDRRGARARHRAARDGLLRRPRAIGTQRRRRR